MTITAPPAADGLARWEQLWDRRHGPMAWALVQAQYLLVAMAARDWDSQTETWRPGGVQAGIFADGGGD